MTGQAGALVHLTQAIRPTLFDAAARPELLIALLYANLMSPSLWELMQRIRQRAAALAPPGGARHAAVLMGQIHDYVDKRFCHAAPLDMAQMMGLLDLREERRRLPPHVVDEALEIILKALAKFQAEGRLEPRQDMVDMIRAGHFPEFDYASLDLIEALGRDSRRKHRPLGVTVCADEAVLMASLALAEGSIGLADLAVLGSPAHYTLFVDHAHERFWFNGKHELHDSRSWRALVEGLPPEGVQAAADDRLVALDRVITPLGVHLLRQHRSTLSPDHMQSLYRALEAYFGVELRQIAEAREGIRFRETPLLNGAGMDLHHPRCAAQVETRVRELAKDHPGSVFELALYAFRSIHVAHPRAYLRQALKGHRVRARADEIRALDQAVAAVRAIPGADSVFHGDDRIALPDEVLHFRTGSHRERALLLYCLIRLSPWIPERDKDDMEVIYWEGASQVRLGEILIDPEGRQEGPRRGRPLAVMQESPGAPSSPADFSIEPL